MIDEENASVELMADIVHIAQRASAETCYIAARTIARQALTFVRTHPDKISSVSSFQDTTRQLCECLLTLQNEVSGTGEEILIKRDALNLLLTISAELIYPKFDVPNTIVEPEYEVAQTA